MPSVSCALHTNLWHFRFILNSIGQKATSRQQASSISFFFCSREKPAENSHAFRDTESLRKYFRSFSDL